MEEPKKDRNLEVATFSMGFLAGRKPRSGFVLNCFTSLLCTQHILILRRCQMLHIYQECFFFEIFLFVTFFNTNLDDFCLVWIFLTLIDYLWGWFWTPQRLFTQVSGVHRATAGYTGGRREAGNHCPVSPDRFETFGARSAKPTYRSVCNGDGCLDLMIWDLWFERWALQHVLNKRVEML